MLTSSETSQECSTIKTQNINKTTSNETPFTGTPLSESRAVARWVVMERSHGLVCLTASEVNNCHR